MTIFLVGAIFMTVMSLMLLYRFIVGPTAADRLCAADAIDLTTTLALVLYSFYCGKAIYLDIAFVTAALGFISTVFVSRYLEGRI